MIFANSCVSQECLTFNFQSLDPLLRIFEYKTKSDMWSRRGFREMECRQLVRPARENVGYLSYAQIGKVFHDVAGHTP